MARTGKSCCDGGMGGECRATRIYPSPNGSGWVAEIDGNLCPVTVPIYYDVSLPREIEAMVCAGKTTSPGVCPATYCAAGSLGS